MSWTAIVPMKQTAGQKSRLADRLSETERTNLTQVMAARVLDALRGVRDVTRILALSPIAPTYPGVSWAKDKGRGLNAELRALGAEPGMGPFLIVHADLPLVGAADIQSLLRAAVTARCAIAPDRHETGTNALALAAPGDHAFAFGEGSFAKHLALWPAAGVVHLQGLSHDIDTPDDLDAAVAAGFQWDAGPKSAI